MKMHISIHLTGIVDVTLASHEDIGVRVDVLDEHVSSYLDDGKGGQTIISPSMLQQIQLAAGEVLTEALLSKIREALKESGTQDTTLNHSTAVGKA